MLESLERRGIRDRCVLAAMTYVPREPFVARADVLDAYADRPLAVAHGQTLWPPFAIARMLQALQLHGNEHALEVGTGAGYTTAVLSQLVAHVYSVESDPLVSSAARARLGALGYDGVDITCRDGKLGWLEHGPYDAILVATPCPELPPALVDQLAVGGRLVIPMIANGAHVLHLVLKTSASATVEKDLGAV